MMNKPIRTYELYEIVKVPFPFIDKNATKKRPALIISTAKFFNARIGMSIMAMITSLKSDRDLWPTDVVIKNLKPTNLPAESMIRFKLFTLDHRLILGRIGLLHEDDRKMVQVKLKEVLAI